ncbi:hypothetical protein MKX01_022006 [Papaver californicum]|nr:hypothetical protein MKX01_022006 [Papaver californicum]
MEEDMLSMVPNITTLNGVVVVGEGCSDSNSTNASIGSNKRQTQDICSVTSSARYKGVVSLPNGHWGAQIYADRRRIWIGTFKSEPEAAMAYDAAAVKLRSEDSRRNYPLTTHTSLEPDFQKLFTLDQVLSMVRDGSYQTKLSGFISSCSLKLDTEPAGLSLSLGSSKDGAAVSYQQLFQKELTPSDVGKLNRLVIPKKLAERYFPEVSKEEKEVGVIDDIQLSFFDREMKCWKFRYCYWRSSQSYVFTRGWSRFVKDKKLKAKDVVTFYKCECQKEHKAFYMIDVASSNGAEGFGTYAAGNRVDLQLGSNHTITINESEPSDRTTTLWQSQEDMEVESPQPEEEEKRAVRLFGVNIS